MTSPLTFCRTLRKIPGSGLGLWIANTFIASSGGTLTAGSPGEDQGTTIRIVFPIAPHVEEDETAGADEPGS